MQRRPCHSQRAGKGVCPEVETMKDTTEQEDLRQLVPDENKIRFNSTSNNTVNVSGIQSSFRRHIQEYVRWEYR